MSIRTWCLRSALLSTLSLFASCDDDDDNGSSPPAVVTAPVGPEGGAVSVVGGDLDGTSISVPPAALTTDVALSFFEDVASIVPGFTAVGPAVRIEPMGLTFAVPAILTLPFDPALVPSTTGTTDYVVHLRLADGRLFEALPRQVDASLGRVTLDVLQLATWWVSVPDTIATRDYLPLGDGDQYVYSSGLQLFVSETIAEPNFNGIPLTKLSFSSFGFVAGFYVVDDGNGALSLIGEFEVAVDDRQERLDSPVLLLGSVETIGDLRIAPYTFTGYVPYGGLVPTYLGVAHAACSLTQRTSVATPLGSFDDVVVFEFKVVRSDTRPRSATNTLRLWLARGVGPVQVQFDQNPPYVLVAGIVGGRPVAPN